MRSLPFLHSGRILASAILVANLLAAVATGAHGQAAVCEFCGNPLPTEALYCSHCGRPVAHPESVYCWRCGEELPADARYCCRCGSQICTDVDAPATRPPGPAVTPGTPAEASAAPELSPDTPPIGDGRPSAPEAAEAGADVRVAPLPSPAPPSEDGGLRRYLRQRRLVLPPRILQSPSGRILPSMALHIGGGWSFGFSEGESSEGWLISLGLGGAGELMIASARILHALDTESHALAGFRVRVPLGLLDRRLERHLSMALNVAATGENDYEAHGAIPAGGSSTVQSLQYDHRETTLGVAATWRPGRLRVHGALHVTDLRTENVSFFGGEGGFGSLDDQRITYTTLGLGLDFAIDARTFAIAEAHSLPRISLMRAQDELNVGTVTEYAAGLRFYPTNVLGLDATVVIDEEAVGLADVEIGFGVHLTLGPRQKDADDHEP